jgi:hypothetical protein
MELKMIKWIKKLFKIVKNYDSDMYSCKTTIKEIRELIVDRTTCHTDIHARQDKGCAIILIGKYKNHDYVECFTLHPDHLRNLIEHFREVRNFSHMGRIDAYPEFKAIIEHEI